MVEYAIPYAQVLHFVTLLVRVKLYLKVATSQLWTFILFIPGRHDKVIDYLVLYFRIASKVCEPIIRFSQIVVAVLIKDFGLLIEMLLFILD